MPNNNSAWSTADLGLGPGQYFGWVLGGFRNLQLDIVGFLAVLGEGSVLANSQVATLSRTVYLPRLLPAPQALLRPSRPDQLDPHGGIVTSVHAGNIRHYINHVGHTLVDAESLPEYSVRCVQIRRREYQSEVKSKMLGPLWVVAVLGCIMSCVLFAVSIWWRDGMACLATVFLSFLSTLIGMGNKWKLNLPRRVQRNIWTPAGDVVIRYPKGNFLVVQCDEDVARELYFAPENINYMIGAPWQYRIISLVGTLMLMFGVIFLGNATLPLQLGFAGAYMLLNAAYWIVAALPSKIHWDMTCFEVHQQCFDTDPKLTGAKKRKYIDYNKTFTQALWKVIIATKDIDWIRRSAAAPATAAWAEWLQEAKTRAKEAKSNVQEINGKTVKVWEVPDWDAQQAIGDSMIRNRDPAEV